MTIAEYLRDEGYDVIEAGSVAEAQAAQDYAFAIIDAALVDMGK